MKKTLLALAVGAFVASTAAQAAQVYDKDGTSLAIGGRLQGVYYGKDAGGDGQPDTGDASLNASGRLNIEARTQLFSGVDGFGYVEWDVSDAEGHSQFDARYAWVGLDFGSLGQVKGGTFENAYYYVLENNDIFDDFGGIGYFGNDDRRQGVVMYSWSGYGVDINLSYETAKQNQVVEGAYGARTYDSTTGEYGDLEKADIEHGGAISVGYTSPDVLFGPIGIRIGYTYDAFSNHTNDADGTKYNQIYNEPYGVAARYDDSDAYGISLSWGTLDLGPYVALLYQIRNVNLVGLPKAQWVDDGEVTGSDIVGGYTFASGVGIYLGVEYQKVEYGDYNAEALVLPVYVTYKVNPNFMFWVEGRLDLGTDDDEDKTTFREFSGYQYEDNVFSLGARFTF